MFFRRFIKKYYKAGNTITTGLRGTGKDMLTANVIARRKEPYISNMDYHCAKSVYIPLDFSSLDVKNSYDDFISGDLVNYNYPYPDGCDIYVSDAGVYYPSQYCNELNKKYPTMPVFQALSRHIGDCNFHVNVQNLNRVWDKIREQADIYVRCRSTYVFKFLPKIPLIGRLFRNLVVTKVTVYDKYDSCVNRVEPFRALRAPLLSHGTNRGQYRVKNEELLRDFKERNGYVRNHILIYKNKSEYDTRLFKGLLKNGKKEKR